VAVGQPLHTPTCIPNYSRYNNPGHQSPSFRDINDMDHWASPGTFRLEAHPTDKASRPEIEKFGTIESIPRNRRFLETSFGRDFSYGHGPLPLQPQPTYEQPSIRPGDREVDSPWLSVVRLPVVEGRPSPQSDPAGGAGELEFFPRFSLSKTAVSVGCVERQRRAVPRVPVRTCFSRSGVMRWIDFFSVTRVREPSTAKTCPPENAP